MKKRIERIKLRIRLIIATMKLYKARWELKRTIKKMERMGILE